MSEDALFLWFALTALSIGFVAVDIRRTPAHPVIKWAFAILALFTGPFAAFFYVLGCREPLRGTHEAYVASRWRQVLGSTMHCAAGDGIGIIAGAAVSAYWRLPEWADLFLEYALGFGFGWAIFQAFAMRDMAGGDYRRSLRETFLPELLSMNFLMAGMVPTMRLLMPHISGSGDPLSGGFWFVMSVSLMAGFMIAYPVNGWLVAHGLKHGMITVRRSEESAEHPASPRAGSPVHGAGESSHASHAPGATVSAAAKLGMGALSVAVLAGGIALAEWLGSA